MSNCRYENDHFIFVLIQEMTEEDEALYMKHRDRHSASFSHYRDNVWEKKV